jgi:hypothetical protein
VGLFRLRLLFGFAYFRCLFHHTSLSLQHSFNKVLPYSESYLQNDNILEHSNGWCSAWPLRMEMVDYGGKLYFSSRVAVREFEESPHYVYFQDRWVGPAIARVHGYSEEKQMWVFETTMWWLQLFPQALNMLSWRYDYLCS